MARRARFIVFLRSEDGTLSNRRAIKIAAYHRDPPFLPRGKVESRSFLLDDRDGNDEFVLFEAREEAYVSNDDEKRTRRRYQIFAQSKINQVGKTDANHPPDSSPFEFGSKFIPGTYQPRFILTFGDINNGIFDLVFAPLARASVDIPRGYRLGLPSGDTRDNRSRFQPTNLRLPDLFRHSFVFVAGVAVLTSVRARVDLNIGTVQKQ